MPTGQSGRKPAAAGAQPARPGRRGFVIAAAALVAAAVRALPHPRLPSGPARLTGRDGGARRGRAQRRQGRGRLSGRQPAAASPRTAQGAHTRRGRLRHPGQVGGRARQAITAGPGRGARAALASGRISSAAGEDAARIPSRRAAAEVQPAPRRAPRRGRPDRSAPTSACRWAAAHRGGRRALAGRDRRLDAGPVRGRADREDPRGRQGQDLTLAAAGAITPAAEHQLIASLRARHRA